MMPVYSDMFLENYIPTRSSAAIIGRYLHAALCPCADRASILIGPYGKGKSHALYVVNTLLSSKSKSGGGTAYFDFKSVL